MSIASHGKSKACDICATGSSFQLALSPHQMQSRLHRSSRPFLAEFHVSFHVNTNVQWWLWLSALPSSSSAAILAALADLGHVTPLPQGP